MTGNYGMQKLKTRAVWGDLLAEIVPILALKCGLIRQVDRKHRIACIVNWDLNWDFEKKWLFRIMGRCIGRFGRSRKSFGAPEAKISPRLPNTMKITYNSLLKSSLLNSLPFMIYSPNRIQRTRWFHTVFFSVPSVPFVIPWCSTRDSRLAAKPIIDAAQDSRKLLRFQRLSPTSCHSPACPKFEPLPKRFFSKQLQGPDLFNPPTY